MIQEDDLAGLNAVEKRKIDIHTQSIKADQEQVASQWAKTFYYNNHSEADDSFENDTATQMMAILAGCVAKANFKIKHHLSKDKHYQAPNKVLTVADYLSHGSRIMIDYHELSEENKQQLLAYFNGRKIISRSATHAAYRQDGDAVEQKGFALGVIGQLPEFLKTAQDFGVNIAFGGINQKNLANNIINDSGNHGHVYFHLNKEDNILMCGLEQSAPSSASTILEHHADQFGQTHSLLGSSDVYTAPGSLYFSDPAYQIKLMKEHNALPPMKYGGMLVKLTNENWQEVLTFSNLLKSNDITSNQTLLLQTPATADKQSPNIHDIDSIEFKQYFKRLRSLVTLFKDVNETTVKATLECINQFEKYIIEKKSDQQLDIQANLNELLDDSVNIIEPIKTCLTQVKQLILQVDESHDAKKHQENQAIIYNNLHDELINDLAGLLNRCQNVFDYYNKPEVLKGDTFISGYLTQLQNQQKILTNTISDARGVNLDSDVTSSFVVVNKTSDHIDKEKIKALTELKTKTSDLLAKPPQLISKKALDKVVEHSLSQTSALAKEKQELQKEPSKSSEPSDELRKTQQELILLKKELAERDQRIETLKEELDQLKMTNSLLKTNLEEKSSAIEALQEEVNPQYSNEELDKKDDQPLFVMEEVDVDEDNLNDKGNRRRQSKSLLLPAEQTKVLTYPGLKEYQFRKLEHSLPRRFREYKKQRDLTGYFTTTHGNRGRVLLKALKQAVSIDDYLTLLNYQLEKFPQHIRANKINDNEKITSEKIDQILNSMDMTDADKDALKKDPIAKTTPLGGFYKLLLKLDVDMKQCRANQQVDELDNDFNLEK